MKNLILLICTVSLYACTSSKKVVREKKLYIGQSKSGYLTVNDAVYSSTKERIEDLFVGQKTNNYYRPSFSLPTDILILKEYELYHSRNTAGFVVYKQDPRSLWWRKVAFLPSMQGVQSIIHDDGIMSITVQKIKDSSVVIQKYRWKAETPNFVEKWVRM